MVEVLGGGLSLHKRMVKLVQMIVNRLDEAGRVIRLLLARGRGVEGTGQGEGEQSAGQGDEETS